MCALLVDYCLRFLGGSSISPLGSLAQVMVAIMDLFGSKPKWMAGWPKQFATFCGVMFTAGATLFFLLQRYNYGDQLVIVGLSITCVLLFAQLLEWSIGFCLGCFFFGLMIQFGLVPKTVYNIFTAIVPEVRILWKTLSLSESGCPRLLPHLAALTGRILLQFWQ